MKGRKKINYLFDIEFEGYHSYLTDAETEGEKRPYYWSKRKFKIVAKNIEETKEKYLNNFWTFLDDAKCKEEIEIINTKMLNAVREGIVDIY